MFAAGEESVGKGLLLTTKPKKIESITNNLDPEEVDFRGNTMFGKIISQAENPSFSGTFGLFVVIRMLRVKKKYEIWLVMQG
ncbi:unnamed protein product [Brassica oleracea]|uniref:(rape) hypothetical protein n=1 Tax=Brassica napus TaxID=3708 RepID=A0A816KWY0_BRANA|nr:unnamed protein product [Brassica napus]